MKSGLKKYLVIILIFIALFNVLVFAIPFPKNGAAFWICYACTTISLLAQVYIAYLAFNKNTLKSKIYGWPIARIGGIYLVVQLVIALICFIVGSFIEIPFWIILVLEVLLIGLVSVGLITTDAYRTEIEKIENDAPITTKFIMNLRVETKLLSERYESSFLNKKLYDLAEEVKYSDPKSNDTLLEIEDEINRNVISLKDTLRNENFVLAEEMIEELIQLIKERNLRCKLSKK